MMLSRQEQVVYDHLLNKGSITALEAFSQYDIVDLAGRIKQLRRKGVPIIGEYINRINKLGERKRYKKYYLEEDYDGREENVREDDSAL